MLFSVFLVFQCFDLSTFYFVSFYRSGSARFVRIREVLDNTKAEPPLFENCAIDVEEREVGWKLERMEWMKCIPVELQETLGVRERTVNALI